MRLFIILGLVSVALAQGGQGGQAGYSGQPGGQGVGYGQQVPYPGQGYLGDGQQPYVLPGGQYQNYYPTYPIQQGPLINPYQYQYPLTQYPYGYPQLGYNPLTGFPLPLPYQTGIVPTQTVPLPLPVEYPVLKEVDFVQPGISGAVPLTTMDAALLELEDKDYGHYEKYYYGRSAIPSGFVRPMRKRQPEYLERSRSGGIPINKFIRPGTTRQPPFKVNKRDHYEIYKYH